jgi:hypothetical protein
MPWLTAHVSAGGAKPQRDMLNIAINRLSGESLCKISVSKYLTVEMLKFEIQMETAIPQMKQRLILSKAQAVLTNGTILDSIAGDSSDLSMNLIQVSSPSLDQALVSRCDSSMLLGAIQKQDSEKCMQLLATSRIPSINDVDIGGATLLHQAAWYGLPEVCQGLLDHPDFVEADAEDNQGLTALHGACSQGHVAVVMLLVSSDVFTAVNARNAQFCRTGFGWTARDLAETFGRTDVLHVLKRAEQRGKT